MHSLAKVAATAFLTSAQVVAAQSSGTSGSIAFNLFEYKGAYLNKLFRFDESYSEKYGVPIEVPFALEVPVRRDLKLIADGRPDGGLVKFTFALETGNGLKFVENFHIVTALFPLFSPEPVPLETRLKSAQNALVKSAFPIATKGFSDIQMLSTGKIDVNGTPAVEVIGTYTDPAIGKMALHLVAIPHPERSESYFVIRNINRALVPMESPAQLSETLGGRILDSFIYF